MKVACLIDSLASGGAERQMTELAVGLRGRGHDVAVCHYHAENTSNSFYESQLVENGVRVERIHTTGRLDRLRKVRSWLNRYQPDVLQSYLPGANALAILTGLARRRWKVVVSERIDPDYRGRGNLREKTIAGLYRGADWIVTNSHSSREGLVSFVPAYRRKTSVIWNCVDLERFGQLRPETEGGVFRFLCVASMGTRKNSQRLVEALALVKKRTGMPVKLRWVGRFNGQLEDHRMNMTRTRELVSRLGLEDDFEFAGEVTGVEAEYRNAEALVLVSTREGLPNVVCEGMASGLPIVAGAVADLFRIVREGENGFLCDPWSAGDIARAMQACVALGAEGRTRFGKASRGMAERMFEKRNFIRKYEVLYEALLAERTVDLAVED